MVIEVDIYSRIRHRYTAGESIRSIAQSLGISRQTVKKYCEGNTHPDVRKPYERPPNVNTDKVKSFVQQCFREDESEHIKKQKHTVRKIYDRLVNEQGYTGSYSSIKRVVQAVCAEKSVPAQADMPLAFEPGEAIQIDWGEATVYLDGQKTKVYMFCGRLCYSCDIFVQAYRAANTEAFLEAQQLMFEYFSGVPKRLIFDNGKVAVKEGFGLHAKPQDKYLSFSAHYAFGLDFCNPAKGNEKGLVENLVGYARRNFFVPVPRVKDMRELNNILLASCREYRKVHKVESHQHTVAELYEEELRFLSIIPRYRFDTSHTTTPTVGDYSTVRFDKNSYSVPIKYLRNVVTVKGYASEICILCDRNVIATYERNYGVGKTEYRLEHYIDLLERKPRAVFNSKPVRDTVTKELLDWGKLLPGGNAEMVKLLRLCVDYGEERILSIKRQMPAHIIPSVNMVRAYLHEPTECPVIYLNRDIEITKTDLATYDEKCGVAK